MSYNKVMLMGNLGKDPEIKYTQNGQSVANFSLATHKVWNDKQSAQKKETTEWHNIEVWGKLAENVSKYLKKGDTCFLEGELKTESWDDKETGKKQYKTLIKVSNVQFAGKKDNDLHEKGKQQEFKPTTREEFTSDDIPF